MSAVGTSNKAQDFINILLIFHPISIPINTNLFAYAKALCAANAGMNV
jgi:hypothetical protein